MICNTRRTTASGRPIEEPAQSEWESSAYYGIMDEGIDLGSDKPEGCIHLSLADSISECDLENSTVVCNLISEDHHGEYEGSGERAQHKYKGNYSGNSEGVEGESSGTSAGGGISGTIDESWCRSHLGLSGGNSSVLMTRTRSTEGQEDSDEGGETIVHGRNERRKGVPTVENGAGPSLCGCTELSITRQDIDACQRGRVEDG